MKQKKLHPSVIKFKEFVRNNPQVVQEVRNGNATWQELYEDWYLLGEDDKRWDEIGKKQSEDPIPSEEKKTDWKSNLFSMMKKMDPNQVEYHMNNLNQAIGAIQGLLSQFQGTNTPANHPKDSNGPSSPFSFRKD